jgi:ribosome assembly protein SQT1
MLVMHALVHANELCVHVRRVLLRLLWAWDATASGDDEDGDDVGELQWRDSAGFEEGKVGVVEDSSRLVFDRHTDSVYSICARASAPGLVVTGGGDDKGYLWRYNRETFQLESVIPLEGHTDSVTSVGISPDGKFVSTAALDGTVRIWRAENGELVHALDGPSDIEWSAWHNTGGVILAGSSDGTVWMWLAATGQCMQVFAGHEGSVPCGNFTGDGRFVVTGGEDASVRVWGPKVGKCRHVFRSERGVPFHEGGVRCLTPHKNGELLASGSEDGTVRLMHVTNQRVVALFVHTLPQPIEAPREEDKDDEGEHDDDNEDDEPEMFDENELEVIDELGEEEGEEEGDDAHRPAPSRDANRGNVIVEDEEVDVSEEDEGEIQEFTEASLPVERYAEEILLICSRATIVAHERICVVV